MLDVKAYIEFYLNMILSQMVDTVPYGIYFLSQLKLYLYILILSWPEFMINIYHRIRE